MPIISPRSLAIALQADQRVTQRVIVVAQRHPLATDDSNGTPETPLRTINAAARMAEPGDVVLVHEGVYRERVAPARGGTADRPITYVAAKGERVCVRGSEPVHSAWHPVPACGERVFRTPLESIPRGSAAYGGTCDERLYGDFDPFITHFDRRLVARPHAIAIAELESKIAQETERRAQFDPMDIALAGAERRLAALNERRRAMTHADPTHRQLLPTLGQLFVDGVPMHEATSLGMLAGVAGAWMVDESGQSLLLHLPAALGHPNDALIEVSVRHTVFAPLERGLGHIIVRGFTFEHAANHCPSWGDGGFAQSGMVSCRSGHHWTIEGNTIRYARSIGLDCGTEGGSERMEHADSGGFKPVRGHVALTETARRVGYHTIRDNRICDNGLCGLAGIGHYGTRVLGNIVERNNRDGWTSPWWEFGGIKFHYFFDGVIDGNLVRDNDGHGIWIDNEWRGSRVTRNILIGNQWSGINVELGRGPLLIDNNVIAHTRHGDGIYGHDCADVTIAHNLLYANANFGIWFAYATPRVKPEDGCWQIRVLNNLVLGNRAGAIGLPLPWDCAGENESDANLVMGGGAYLDEGSGPQAPLFQITNATHCAPMQHVLGAGLTAQRAEVVWANLTNRLAAAGASPAVWPAKEAFVANYLLSFDQWRAAMGVDQRSVSIRMVRDGLSPQSLTWKATFDAQVDAVVCVRVAGLDHDLTGIAYTADAPIKPGPFQDLACGTTTRVLWPLLRRGDVEAGSAVTVGRRGAT